jgi:hypothetical protein
MDMRNWLCIGTALHEAFDFPAVKVVPEFDTVAAKMFSEASI